MGKSFEIHWLMILPLAVLLMESDSAPARQDISLYKQKNKYLFASVV